MSFLVALGAVFYYAQKIQGKALRAYKTYLIQKNSLSKKVLYISEHTILKHPENIYFGERSSINGGILSAGGGSIRVGDNCLISYNVQIRTDAHCYKDRNTLILDQGHTGAEIVVEDDVWIGHGAQIMPGVTVSRGCVIGAGAIVTKSTEPYGVYVGVPAKCIAHRLEKCDE